MRRLLFLIPLALSLACVFPLMMGPTDSSVKMGTLSVTINYTDTFYREVFDYTPDAPNIWHFVLVLPASEAQRESAPQVLYSVRFPEKQGDPWITNPELQWAEPYLYQAPGATFTGSFAPGDYQVAALFLAGPISAEEAGVEEGTLYAGITGGGASTDLIPVHISAGEDAQITITMTDADGWACPWLYVFNGTEYERRTEILRDIRDQQQTEITPLGAVPVVNGAIRLRISEEKAETTHLDQLYLLVNGERISAGDPALDEQDNQVVVLNQGDTRDIRFALPEHLQDTATVSVVAAGYYITH